MCFLLVMTLFGATFCPAQEPEVETGTASIYGFVKSDLDSTVIPNANVVLVGTTRGDATNDFGYYRITRLPAGRYIIEIRVIGFRRFLREVILSPTDHVQIDAYLEHLQSLQSENEFLDLESAKRIAAQCKVLLDGLDAEYHQLVQAGIHYFIEKDDAESDLDSPIGFDDDAEVIRLIAKEMGREDVLNPGGDTP